MLGIIT